MPRGRLRIALGKGAVRMFWAIDTSLRFLMLPFFAVARYYDEESRSIAPSRSVNYG